MIGSRDADARAAETACGLGATRGAANADACRRRRPGRPRDEGRRCRSTPHPPSRDAIGTTPVLSVAAELTSCDGVPEPERPLARRTGRRRFSTGPVVAGLHSLAARNLGREEPPDEDASSAATTPTRRRSRSSSPTKISRAGRALDAGPLPSARPRPRRASPRLIVNVNKRYKAPRRRSASPALP